MKSHHVLPAGIIGPLLLALLVGPSSCATARETRSRAVEASPAKVGLTSKAEAMESIPEGSPVALSPEALRAIRDIERQILEADGAIERGADAPPAPAEVKVSRKTSRSKIPIEINESVRRWIHYFTVRDRERFQRFLNRGVVYKPLIQKMLRENGVPTDLYYLAMIESGFTLHAKSHAGAVGPWQFIRGTGKLYGLQQNHYIDERREIIHSTEAAAKYLKSLHTAFQSWYLAMAGYNAGEGRILGAILRGKTRDFWELVERKKLPPETREYVPKFLAAVIIGKNPGAYGFKIAPAATHPALEPAVVPGGVSLAAVSRSSGIPVNVLRQANPHLLRGVVPPSLKAYPIWVPVGQADRVDSEVLTVARSATKRRTPERRVASAKKRRTKTYRVRRGDALTSIAARYNTSVSKLKRLNSLKSTQIKVGQRIQIAAGN